MSGDIEVEAERVEVGVGPPLRRGKLPKPPRASHLLGPGIVLAAMGIGMGEMIMWPRMALMWGSGVLCLAREREKLINNNMESLRINKRWNGLWKKFIT